jgi:single-strand DNA-binding protein
VVIGGRMNKVILIGLLTKDPDVRRSQEGKAIARYTLAVDRWGKEKAADFIQCVAFDKKGEFAEQYFRKGMKIAITGRIQTGKYTNKDGQTVYTTDVIIDDQEFCESKGTHPQEAQQTDGFVSVPDDFRPPWEG